MDKDNFVILVNSLWKIKKDIINTHVIKNVHIYCTKDAYKIFQKTITSPINNDLKYLIHENCYLFFKWNDEGKSDSSY